MEKLIKLLNEYKIYTEHKKSRMSEYTWINVGDDIVMASYVGTTHDKTLEIISKKFLFIKWLVDNKKIDLDKRPTRNKYRLQQYKTELGGYGKIDEYSELLMLLSIQDNPIEFLISILK